MLELDQKGCELQGAVGHCPLGTKACFQEERETIQKSEYSEYSEKVADLKKENQGIGFPVTIEVSEGRT